MCLVRPLTQVRLRSTRTCRFWRLGPNLSLLPEITRTTKHTVEHVPHYSIMTASGEYPEAGGRSTFCIVELCG